METPGEYPSLIQRPSTAKIGLEHLRQSAALIAFICGNRGWLDTSVKVIEPACSAINELCACWLSDETTMEFCCPSG